MSSLRYSEVFPKGTMKTFKDNAGRTWSLSIDVSAIKRIKGLAGVDLLAIGSGDGKVLSDLSGNPVMLVDVLYAACKPEADRLQVTDEQFGSSMGGDAIDAATTALMSEVVDFFPSRQRAVLKAALAKVEQSRDIAMQRALANVEALDVMKLIDSGNSSTNLPASSDSIPAPSRSES